MNHVMPESTEPIYEDFCKGSPYMSDTSHLLPQVRDGYTYSGIGLD